MNLVVVTIVECVLEVLLALLSIRNLNFRTKVYKFSLSTAHTGAKASSSICEYFLSVAVKGRLIHQMIFVSCGLFGSL
jgi:hypothetical protein